jgi:uncharacterized SAM-binding protein YcdF (DUF218 family)
VSARRWRLGARQIVALGLAVAVVFWLVVAGWLFVSPSSDQLRPVDAVVVFAGGGPRADQGVELIEQGLADTIVFFSAWVEDLDLWAVAFCNARSVEVPGHVMCFEPDPQTTQGEARGLARLAETNDWDEVVVVVSTDQVWRARLLVGRCWPGEVLVSAVDHDQSALYRMVYETGASLEAVTFKRGC